MKKRQAVGQGISTDGFAAMEMYVFCKVGLLKVAGVNSNAREFSNEDACSNESNNKITFFLLKLKFSYFGDVEAVVPNRS